MAGNVNNRWVWRNGEIIADARLRLAITTYALHYAYGVFEGIRGRLGLDGWHHIFRLRDHVARLFNSARILGIEIPYTPEQIVRACQEIYIAEELRQGGYIRPIIFVGEGPLGLGAFDNPLQVVVIAWPWGKYLGDGTGTKLAIDREICRPDMPGDLNAAKYTGGYTLSTIVKKRAKARGFEDAVMLDPRGNVAECTGMNIFALFGRRLVTPKLGNILSGITRDTVKVIGRQYGLEIVEADLLPERLFDADEVFVTGTAAEITPVIQIEDRVIGSGAAGEVTKDLQRIFFRDTTGGNTGDSCDHPEWRHSFKLPGV